MRRQINKVAVLGSGVMGSRIACHFANTGHEVLLLDISPRELNEKEKAAGLELTSKKVRNRIVDEALQSALKSNPSPIYSKEFAKRITTGNFDEDLGSIKDCDWVIEAIIEDLNIKKGLFEKIEPLRQAGSLITTNTSGIPIHLLAEGRSDDFKKNFFGSHFFNPPRYLSLLEIIPGPETSPESIDFMMHYGGRFLGKKTILCKDTPGFIANRVAIYAILSIFRHSQAMGMSVTDVDKLTGPLIGRAKSATFRTSDVVGIDTLVRVAKGIEATCPNDESIDGFKVPDYVEHLISEGALGSKSGKGFYQKVKSEDGSKILALNLETKEYEEQQKTKFASLEALRPFEHHLDRIKSLYNAKDAAGEFTKKTWIDIFAYISNRIPEIADNVYQIDDAIKAGFGWKSGPFETWDAVGLKEVIADLKEAGKQIPEWLEKIDKSNIESFYRVENGEAQFLTVSSLEYTAIPGAQALSLAVLRADHVIWKNEECSIFDLGDGILNIEFHSKMNTIGAGIIGGLNKAIDMAEADYKGLVIYNEGDAFTAGANVGMIFMMAAEQEMEELDMAVRSFQNTVMRLRYSDIPVVVAPHNLCLGGGAEMCLHADKVVAHAELYIGLVEFGVGIIPGGAGTKEFTVRLSDEMKEGDIRTNTFRKRFLTIGQAQVATSAEEAFELGYLRRGIDEWVVNRADQLAHAKRQALALWEKGYKRPIKRTDITVLGKEAMGLVYIGANTMYSGNYISEHDKKISEKLGFVMSGGDLSEPTEVSEDYLLQLERKKFLELCMERKTLERMQSLIKTGKILRN
ncbi:3-hydroxyacyl-CoA dehydrogenase/enoyl-CoA hydratase family protein [Salibacteraceae bacterium]|jgi:3-hydroxyacyl-CoA dehydrogenase|nr:3-hydroxyacyl-CoA dehydrogenase/enoyl-CoA hydratase family protein [Salibacteraceae bacterium]